MEKWNFDQSEINVEAQALNKEVTANAATSNEHAVSNDDGQTENQTTINGKQLDVAVQDSVFRAKLHADMESKGAIKQEYYTYKFSDLIAMNYIFATFVMNREVNEKHVKMLMNDVRTQGKKAFSQHVTVCSALSALLLGYDAISIDGKPVTLETGNLDKILVIIDGQHRVAACLGTELDIDCDVMIVPCPKEIAQDIKDRNCCDKNWDTSALRHQIVEVKKKQDVLAEYEKRAKEIYPGCSDKFYTTMLNAGKKDAVRRAQVARGELPSCNVEDAEVGLVILRSLRQLNPNCSKNASKTLKIVDSIMNMMRQLTERTSMTYKEFMDKFRVFASQHEGACESKEGAEGFIANFSEKFDHFLKHQREDIDDETIAAIDNKVHEIINAGPAKVLKSRTGSLHEMIQRIKDGEEVTAIKAAIAAEKAAKKAQKEAMNAAKKLAEQKAKEAGKMVEDLAMKDGREIKGNSNT